MSGKSVLADFNANERVGFGSSGVADANLVLLGNHGAARNVSDEGNGMWIRRRRAQSALTSATSVGHAAVTVMSA